MLLLLFFYIAQIWVVWWYTTSQIRAFVTGCNSDYTEWKFNAFEFLLRSPL
jgi:hypothetical protein